MLWIGCRLEKKGMRRYSLRPMVRHWYGTVHLAKKKVARSGAADMHHGALSFS